jgi:hypothetical protein
MINRPAPRPSSAHLLCSRRTTRWLLELRRAKRGLLVTLDSRASRASVEAARPSRGSGILDWKRGLLEPRTQRLSQSSSGRLDGSFVLRRRECRFEDRAAVLAVLLVGMRASDSASRRGVSQTAGRANSLDISPVRNGCYQTVAYSRARAAVQTLAARTREPRQRGIWKLSHLDS